MEFSLDTSYRLPIVLTIEGALNYAERMALEEIDPHFQNLRWEMVDSSVNYFNKSMHNRSESGEKVEIQLVVYL